MAISKVLLNDRTLVDMTDATAKQGQVLLSYSAYGADGQKMTGTRIPSSNDIYLDEDGFINFDAASITGHAIASGTVIGGTTSVIQFPIGKRMAQTDFIVTIWLPNGKTIPDGGTTRKVVVSSYVCPKQLGYFNLSTNGTITKTSTISFIATASDGTNPTTRTPNYGFDTQIYSRGPTLDAQEGWSSVANTRIIKDNTGFQLYFYKGSSQYLFIETETYNWEIVYFGTDPDNDIVEVP